MSHENKFEIKRHAIGCEIKETFFILSSGMEKMERVTLPP
jgi:hypothetical protein